MTIDDLLERRLLFTAGKGGVGRTTIALALALAAAKRGRRVLMVELEGARGLAQAVEAQKSAPHQAPGVGSIDYIMVEGRRALEEYLALVIPVRRLLRIVFSSTVYQYFVAAAPGLKELMAIGKIWYEVERTGDEKSGRRRDATAPDIVIVDPPATGHSLQYLRMPGAALEAFPVGLVNREAQRVVELLRDADKTAVVLVTTAEEMPANETVEIHRGLEKIGLSSRLLVVNQVHEAPCTDQEMGALRAAVADGDPLFGEVVARAEEEVGWARLNETHLERLRTTVPLPMVCLPLVLGEEFGPDHVVELSERLEAQLAERPTKAGQGARKR